MLTSLIDVLAVLLPVLITVAYVTLLERKALASMQRRIGPDTVGLYGVGQPFADALKLLVKELVMPQQAQKTMFVISPAIALITALLGWAVIPFGSGLVISDLELGWLFYLAAASVGVYGIIFSGWSGNSVFAFMGALRSTAQLISYELALGAAALASLVLAGTFNLSLIVEEQQAVWYAIPLLPVFLLFLITCLAEVNRTPFDLAEAESELVAGFFTEHSAFLFVAFFLAEYCSIALISTITAILWLGGYAAPFVSGSTWFFNLSGMVLGIKVVSLIFGIIWVRGTLPRLRYDQLMSLCWFILLPVVFGLIVLVFSFAVIF